MGDPWDYEAEENTGGARHSARATGKHFGLSDKVAFVALPFAAGAGEVLAMGGFYCGWRWAETAATLALACMFAAVAYAHTLVPAGGSSPIPPLVFVAICAIKLFTAPKPHAKQE